jgi:Rrf2 family nitric oxide-sensitive transcriptional repressor
MKLTSFTDYSLRVLIYLAAEPGRRATIAEISSAFDISENHLTKVAHFLGKQGWISTVRGKGGGLALARRAEDIGVGAVVRDTEGAAMPAECFDVENNHCAILKGCRLKKVLADAVRAFYEVLDRYTVEDISRSPQVVSTIVQFQRRANAGYAARR